jgi:hypothetical protein
MLLFAVNQAAPVSDLANKAALSKSNYSLPTT